MGAVLAEDERALETEQTTHAYYGMQWRRREVI